MGSWRTGFAMSHSDLNFLLPVQDPLRSVSSIRSPSPARPQMLRLHREVLEKVETALRKSPKYSLELERTSSQGLAAIHEPTGLRIQFQCGEGIPASVEYIRDYHAEYPILRSLYMTTRLILETKKLFGSDSESIRSETLIMVLAAFLKMNHGRFRREDSCAQALLAFLRSLGLEINLASTGIAVDPPGLFNAGSLKAASRIYKSENEDLPAHLRGQYALLKTKKGPAARKPAAASQLCVQDPANYMNDLGRSCKRTPEIQAGFAKAYKSLQEALSLWEEPEPQATRKSILNNVLHANFHAFHLRRRLLGNPM
ncbi:hypothetical protein ARAM_006045 [Aspergillus rambellii]|uniref:Uncharacterized protein n=1 Tax=Aspergillus rambellii TaxID=308745 RepID=A0A0F8VNL6_9EURO|nr:hypothetical protein ARAM_006045 [Aspergillus rambellii]